MNFPLKFWKTEEKKLKTNQPKKKKKIKLNQKYKPQKTPTKKNPTNKKWTQTLRKQKNKNAQQHENNLAAV